MVIHWWVRDKLEPLTANRVLAVEGISDRIIVQRAAQLTGRSLDRLGVSLIETDGSGDMDAIVKLFGADGFQVPLSLLIDEDARTDTAVSLGVLPADVEQHGVFVSDADLEAEYIAALGATDAWSAIWNSGHFSPNMLKNCAGSGPEGAPTEADLRPSVGDGSTR